MPRQDPIDWITEEKLVLLEGWARDGLTDEQIAKNMGISARTLYRWKKLNCQICQALKKGKEFADREVENALFKSAKGYDYEEVRTEKDSSGNVVKEIRITKHAQGNPTAQIFWLKNRKPEYWKDGGIVPTPKDDETQVVVYIPDNDRDSDGNKE